MITAVPSLDMNCRSCHLPAMKTALCLRMAIWRKKEPKWIIYGIPSTLYTDHGSDFTSAHIEQVCIDLKINLIFSQIAQPRGRGKIERFFLTLNQKILCELPGYTKSKNKTPQWTLAELDPVLRQFIIEYNHSKHSQTDVSPASRWEQGGFLPHMPECIEQLDLLLFTLVKPRKFCGMVFASRDCDIWIPYWLIMSVNL